MNFKSSLVANYLQAGGVVSIPTDTIQGLSCLPSDCVALRRVVTLKQRSENKGLILLSSSPAYLRDFVADTAKLNQLQSGLEPTTYLLKAKPGIDPLLTGGFDTVAVRITDNALIQSLCEKTQSALVSTSANISGHEAATSILQLRKFFSGDLDYVLAPKNYNAQASKIINLETGERVR